MFRKTVGQSFIICSRICLIVLNVLTCVQWICLALAIHFLVMLGWIIEQRTQNRKDKMEWVYRLKMAAIYCLYFSYLKNGKLPWRRRIWHVIFFVENLALLPVYLVNSTHNNSIKIAAVSVTIFTMVVGILLVELVGYNNPDHQSNKPSFNRIIYANESQETQLENGKVSSSSSTKPNLSPDDLEKGENCLSNSLQNMNSGMDRSNEKSENHKRDVTVRNSVNSSSSLGKRETMCSIQDLLANTSRASTLYNDKDLTKEESCGAKLFDCSSKSCVQKSISNASINEVGLPVKENLAILPCQTYPSQLFENTINESGEQNLVLPTSPQSNLEMLKFRTRKTKPLNLVYPPTKRELRHTNNMVNANENLMSRYNAHLAHLRNFNNIVPSEDYESICNSVMNEWDKSLNNFKSPLQYHHSRKSLMMLLQSTDNNFTFQSLSSRDYENIPTLNAYRANTGLRYWRPYCDIASNVHDYSTFKERSAIQDSTVISNLYPNIELNADRPYSMAEKASSNYSVSLPDLSNLIYCSRNDIGSPQINHSKFKMNETDLPKGEENDEDTPPNYETIWYDDISNYNKFKLIPSVPSGLIVNNSKSLYSPFHGKLPRLIPVRNAHPAVKRNNSINSMFPAYPSSDVLRHVLTNACDNNSSKTGSTSTLTSNTLKTPNNKEVKRVDSKRTQKSPLMKLVSLSQNSLNEHKARALQVGKKVFQRQRVHVITPKKDVAQFQRQDQLNSKIDPHILKKRSQLSPKNKLILCEASALIHKNIASSGCSKNLSTNGFFVTGKESALSSGRESSIASGRGSVTILNSNNPDSCTREIEPGPQHSTPENNKHLPQMSMLSAISSVASPVETLKNDGSSLPTSSHLGSISGQLTINMVKCSSFNLNEAPVIEEFQSVPSQV